MEVLQMFRRKAEKRMVELSPDEARLLRGALLAFRNKLLSAGKPTEDVNELIIKETVRKIRKLGVENAAEILSTRDKSAALVLICCFNMKEGHYKRKRPTSGLYHCHNSVYSEEIYNSSEIVGKETKPGFSRYL